MDIRIAFQLVMFILILNIVSGMVLSLAVPGTTYSSPLVGTGTTSQYEERFDTEEFMNQSQPSLIETWPYLGNIWSTIMSIWNTVRFTVAGFPMLLEQVTSALPSTTSRSTFTTISGVLQAIFAFIILFWFYQLITGRTVET